MYLRASPVEQCGQPDLGEAPWSLELIEPASAHNRARRAGAWVVWIQRRGYPCEDSVGSKASFQEDGRIWLTHFHT